MDTAPSLEVFVGRQPIIDREGQLFGYELLFRSGHVNRASIGDERAASASVIDHVLSDLGVAAALGPYRGFINVDASLLMSDALRLLPAQTMVIELLETIAITPEVIARAADLRAAGFMLALDDVVALDASRRALLPLVDIVKVDVLGMPDDQLLLLTDELKASGVALLAEKIDTPEQAERCRSLGYDLFQGYFFARPTIISGRKLSHSQLALMRLLDLLLSDADTPVIEAALKPEPGLTLGLLRLTNSVGGGARRPVASLRDAIVHLGRRQLQRWLHLLMFADGGSKKRFPSPLLLLAAARGRFMEKVTELSGGDTRAEDRAFVTGIMSLMPALLAVPMEQVVDSVQLGEDIAAALLRREGPLGRLLRLAEALDSNDLAGLDQAMSALPELNMDRVGICLSEALGWSNSIGQEPAPAAA